MFTPPKLSTPPKRIVSLVPSQTELLADLGLGEEVVGITKFCVHPDSWFRSKTRIGGTKQIDIELVASLQPDLVIANKEENVKEQVEALEKIAPVWVTDVNTVEDALDMIENTGILTNKRQEAFIMAADIRTQLTALQVLAASGHKKQFRTAYLIWKDPYMAAGGDTFIHHMLGLVGWKNIFSDQPRYPSVLLDELVATQPELLLLSSEPYPFRQKHIDLFQEALPDAQICLVDGEIFSWYGSHLLQAGAYLKNLLYKLNL